MSCSRRHPDSKLLKTHLQPSSLRWRLKPRLGQQTHPLQPPAILHASTFPFLLSHRALLAKPSLGRIPLALRSQQEWRFASSGQLGMGREEFQGNAQTGRTGRARSELVSRHLREVLSTGQVTRATFAKSVCSFIEYVRRRELTRPAVTLCSSYRRWADLGEFSAVCIPILHC